MNIADLLQRSARLTPDAPALAQGKKVVASQAQLRDEVASLAAGLAARGVGVGDRVAILAANAPDYVRTMMAIFWCGAAAVPINAKLHRRELDDIVEDSDPALLITSPSMREATEGLERIEWGSKDWAALAANTPMMSGPVERTLDDLAWLFFTSGTTGRSKGAMISHGNLLSAVQGYFSDVDDPPWGAAMLHFAPFSHGTGLYALPLMARGGVQVFPDRAGFDGREVFDLIEMWPQACMFAAPTMVQRMTAAKPADADTSNLRTIVYGGGPLYGHDREAALDAFGPIFAQIYGQGECPMTITSQSRRQFSAAAARGDTTFLDSVGAPFTGTQVRICKPDGSECETGNIGEVTVRSATVVCGYWKNESGTTEALRNGWLWTGDLGFIDERGLLHLSGRSKEMIVTGGSNVYPIEVENVLLAHEAVREAAVLGIVDAEWGEAVVAFVVMEGGEERTGELDAWCRDHLTRFKCPKRYEFREELPKNAYGKVAKRELGEG